jgi:hypothetical protein
MSWTSKVEDQIQSISQRRFHHENKIGGYILSSVQFESVTSNFEKLVCLSASHCYTVTVQILPKWISLFPADYSEHLKLEHDAHKQLLRSPFSIVSSIECNPLVD